MCCRASAGSGGNNIIQRGVLALELMGNMRGVGRIIMGGICVSLGVSYAEDRRAGICFRLRAYARRYSTLLRILHKS